ncbi:hypothetical protein Gbem_2390 [Citrifermentans bemidjiense Bem]|uniref:Uncharacterized protein n=1 Tax=Citrifermentans bemidjiense (strain ATCC BAA-1014 / DSM 16622 / JCM 12645 / Bem) TaxID=404380 RepID=B5EF91_CITBB|nr:geopeptide [Citrifermentans bemidjiense]ACH39400.1 hypothetical protein Gbem_2390 [Citrifermentans bemidjiense Bem]
MAKKNVSFEIIDEGIADKESTDLFSCCWTAFLYDTYDYF